ncbi:MAG: PAS domain S-box protein [Magnetococcales bacterium]|nr:PAS domain S-box protein [Magnetococcales bacterium]
MFGPVFLLLVFAVGGWLVYRQFQQRPPASHSQSVINSSGIPYPDFFEASLEALVIADSQGRIRAFNPAAEALFGFVAQEVIGQEVVEVLVPQALRERYRQGFARYLATGESALFEHRVEFSVLRADGEEVATEIALTQVSRDGEKYLHASLRDITERKQMLKTMEDALASLESTNWQLRAQAQKRRLVEEALQASEQKYRSITESASDAIITADQWGNIITWNGGAERIFGYTLREITGQPVQKLMPEGYREAHNNGVQRVREGGAWAVIGQKVELYGMRANGETFPLELSLSSWKLEEETFFSAFIRDISDRKVLEDKNHRAFVFRIAISALLETGLETLPLEKQLHVALNIILTVPTLAVRTEGAVFLWDGQRQKLVLSSGRGLGEESLPSGGEMVLGGCGCGHGVKEGRITFINREGGSGGGRADHFGLAGNYYCVPIRSREKLLAVMFLAVADNHLRDSEEEAFLTTVAITLASLIERRGIEEHIRHLANYDSLTNLPNRKMFEDRLERDLARARRDRKDLALLFLDLDRFKAVNDTLGHDVGDRLLIQAASRIQGCLREVDTVARLGGDEFTVLLPGLSQREDAGQVAAKIIQQLTIPFDLEGNTCQIGSSIGISFYPMDGDNPQILLQKADMAMYAVKKKGRNDYCFFSKELQKYS